MKRKLIGLALLVPLASIIPAMVKSCHQGGDTRNMSGSLVDNLLTAVFMLGVSMAVGGFVLLFTKKGTASAPKDEPPH